MKKILLMALPFYRLMGSHFNGMNLGLSYLAATLKTRGFNVGIYNADYYDSNKYLSQREIFDGYSSYIDIIKDENHPLWDEVVKNVLEWDPHYLGISLRTSNYPSAKLISRKIKSIRPDIKIILGGVHATLAYRELMSESWFDFIIRGEGEFTLLDFMNGVPLERINGLSYRKPDGTGVHNPPREAIPDLDMVPFPDRDSFITATHNMDLGQIISGRGCPFACTYCASPAMWGRKNVRFRSVYDVVSELELLSKRYQTSMIYISDDTFTMKRGRSLEICDELKRRNLGVTWKCDTRADCLDEELVAHMKGAGCELIKIGVESGSDRILKMIRKGETKQKMMAAARTVKEQGIKLTVYLMIGFPGETDEDVRKTIDFAHELDADYYSLSVLAPYYGTEIYNSLQSTGFELKKENWEYFYHQSRKMVANNTISEVMVEQFLSINDGRQRI